MDIREFKCEGIDFSPDPTSWELKETSLIVLDEKGQLIHVRPNEAKVVEKKVPKFDLIGFRHLYHDKSCPEKIKIEVERENKEGKKFKKIEEIELGGVVYEKITLLGVPVVHRWGFGSDKPEQETHCIWSGSRWVWYGTEYGFDYYATKGTMRGLVGRSPALHIRLRILHKESRKEIFTLLLERKGSETEGRVVPNS